MVKISLTWEQVDRSIWRSTLEQEPIVEWLVELTPIGFDDMKIVEIVEAGNEWQAIWFAFQSRNIPSNWHVTGCERA